MLKNPSKSYWCSSKNTFTAFTFASKKMCNTKSRKSLHQDQCISVRIVKTDINFLLGSHPIFLYFKNVQCPLGFLWKYSWTSFIASTWSHKIWRNFRGWRNFWLLKLLKYQKFQNVFVSLAQMWLLWVNICANLITQIFYVFI